ncbi:MAG: OmpA family protein [Cupriavidus sp.]|nr:MAG: OmpA family protein [Cupriavidus sp.]
MKVSNHPAAGLYSLLLLTACSAPPRPPAIDESLRRPANTAAALEHQSCRADLQRAQLESEEQRRLAESRSLTIARLEARQHALEIASARANASTAANQVLTVYFEHGSTRTQLPPDVTRALAQSAALSPLIMLRGRTDGIQDSAVESRIARDRAAAVRDLLIAQGVSPARIRTTHQPVGDHAADNLDANGRALNRRVEIELYRALPERLDRAQPEEPQGADHGR